MEGVQRFRAGGTLSALGLGLAVVAVMPAFAACGEDDAQEPPPRPPETAQQVPDLPRGWTVERNAEHGFALGAPPGWRSGGACGRIGAAGATATVLCSPDGLVTLSVSADRTDEALEISPDEFATRTLNGLGEGFEDELAAGKPRRFEARYEGAAVRASGTAKTGVEQDVTVVVLRRDRVANFTAVIASNAEKPTEPAVELAEQALRSLRSQPVGAVGG
jgi:hypothetical protein